MNVKAACRSAGKGSTKAQFSTALRFLFFERWQIADDRKQNNNILNYEFQSIQNKRKKHVANQLF